jgi:quaternary ammonium compound-resistance protein SugE
MAQRKQIVIIGPGFGGTAAPKGLDWGAMRQRGHRKDYNMSWLYLVMAGVLEIGWPVGLKMAQNPATRITGILTAIAFMVASGFFLWLAQKHIPMGTAYAIWTGIGAAGTFLVGVLVYHDPTSAARFAGVGLILAGVVTLKVGH